MPGDKSAGCSATIVIFDARKRFAVLPLRWKPRGEHYHDAEGRPCCTPPLSRTGPTGPRMGQGRAVLGLLPDYQPPAIVAVFYDTGNIPDRV
jgi:hypothetical protein